MTEPTATGKLKYPDEPVGYYPNHDGENLPCTCEPGCPSACKGYPPACKSQLPDECEACQFGYGEFLGSRDG